jgi:hypothetical protein
MCVPQQRANNIFDSGKNFLYFHDQGDQEMKAGCCMRCGDFEY